jgi:TolB-like protein
MSLVQELNRRNVIRIGILYVVAAWLLLQLTDVLSSLLPVPPWAGPLVIMLLAIGFFPVLIFAWVYEMTPEGLKREADIDRTESVTAGTGRKINTLIVVLLVLAISALAADRLVPETPVFTEVAKIQTDDMSIAVLPFADLSAEQDQQYFTDGLSEELLNLLVRVDDLRVASRTSSFAFRDSTLGIPEISRALNVGHILEGSVRKDGARIRITAQLIETSTDRHLWSENFDRELTDIFAIQDEIANAIVQALTGKMGIDGNKAITVEAVTENLDAYELYLKARELFIKREKPTFARAWESLAAVEIVTDDWISDDGIDHIPLAEEAAKKALSLDADLSMPLAVLGLLSAQKENGVPVGLDYYAAAIRKDPNNTTAWLWQGLELKQSGYVDDAIASFLQCLVIDPGYQNCRQHMADAYLLKGMPETAFRLFDETMEHAFMSISDAFVSSYVRSGHRNLALLIADAKLGYDGAPIIEWIRAIENPDADNSAGLARMRDWERRTTTGIRLRDVPSILLTFRNYDDFTGSDSSVGWVFWHPDGDEFRRSPQFKSSIRYYGMLKLWRTRGFPPQCRPIGDDDFECGRPPAD